MFVYYYYYRGKFRFCALIFFFYFFIICFIYWLLLISIIDWLFWGVPLPLVRIDCSTNTTTTRTEHLSTWWEARAGHSPRYHHCNARAAHQDSRATANSYHTIQRPCTTMCQCTAPWRAQHSIRNPWTWPTGPLLRLVCCFSGTKGCLLNVTFELVCLIGILTLYGDTN